MGLGVIEPWHLVIILIIALVIFGPGKLGDVGGSLGRGIREFKSSISAEAEEDKKDKEKKDAAKDSQDGKVADVPAAKKEASEKAS